MRHIHWLGAGLSSAPGIRRLAVLEYPITVWNRTLAKAQAAVAGPYEETITLVAI